MRKFVLVLGAVLGLSGFAFAQEVPRVEVYGGYSYLNLDTNNLGPRQSANGWEASASGDFNRWLAIEGDFAGYYKTYGVDLTSLGLGTFNVNVHDYSYFGGPRITLRPAFFHVLVGGDKLTGSALGFSASQTRFATAFGGGVQWKVAPHMAVRASADYVLTHHNIFGGSGFTQNNIRASVGIVYTLGGTSQGSSRLRNPTPRISAQQTSSTPAQSEPTSEAALLGVSGYEYQAGFKITAVRVGSPASQLPLNPGDVILKIDGREVHNSREIESAIAASTSGTIIVSYLFQTTAVGMAGAEREVRIR
jgi:hypothetical protein